MTDLIRLTEILAEDKTRTIFVNPAHIVWISGITHSRVVLVSGEAIRTADSPAEIAALICDGAAREGPRLVDRTGQEPAWMLPEVPA